MISETLLIVSLVSIWMSLLMSTLTLTGATHFWLRHATKLVTTEPLHAYPKITIVVPAHNEELVIAKTTRAILDMNYPAAKVELILIADNCTDHTADVMRAILNRRAYRFRNARVFERHDGGGKAGALNDALKMAPVVKALAADPDLEPITVVTGQHREMLQQVLDVFNLTPDFDLKVMEKHQSLTSITTKILAGLGPIIESVHPDMVLVHGDTTTTMAAAMASFYHRVPVGHVEAGLRTWDKYSPYPEEMNRQVTDDLADLYFAPTNLAAANLKRENHPLDRIVITGNTAIDALQYTDTVNPDYHHDLLQRLNPAHRNLAARSYLIMTDSGGIQEEAPSLNRTVLVLRDSTERPEGVRAGTLKLVGTDPARIKAALNGLLEDPLEYTRMATAANPYGNGHAAEAIVKAIKDYGASV